MINILFENLIINEDKWELQPLEFNTQRNFEKNNIDFKNIFGFYGSEFQPFNQAPFFNN